MVQCKFVNFLRIVLTLAYWPDTIQNPGYTSIFAAISTFPLDFIASNMLLLLHGTGVANVAAIACTGIHTRTKVD